MGMNTAAAIIGGLGAITGGYVRGKKDREEYEYDKARRDKEKEAWKIAEEFQQKAMELSGQGEKTPMQEGTNLPILTKAPTKQNASAPQLDPAHFPSQQQEQQPVGPQPAPQPAGPAAGADVAQPPKPLPSAKKFQELYQWGAMRTIGNPYAAEAMKPALAHIRSLGMAQWSNEYKGDLNSVEGAIAYARHMGEGAAQFGTPRDPDDAIRYAKELRTMRQSAQRDGYMDAGKAFFRGDLKGMNAALNGRGKVTGMRMDTVDFGGQQLPSWVATYVDEEGEEQELNALEWAALFGHTSAAEKMYGKGKTEYKGPEDSDTRGQIQQGTAAYGQSAEALDPLRDSAAKAAIEALVLRNIPQMQANAIVTRAEARADKTGISLDEAIKQELQQDKPAEAGSRPWR